MQLTVLPHIRQRIELDSNHLSQQLSNSVETIQQDYQRLHKLYVSSMSSNTLQLADRFGQSTSVVQCEISNLKESLASLFLDNIQASRAAAQGMEGIREEVSMLRKFTRSQAKRLESSLYLPSAREDPEDEEMRDIPSRAFDRCMS
jgi:hypothetical protein